MATEDFCPANGGCILDNDHCDSSVPASRFFTGSADFATRFSVGYTVTHAASHTITAGWNYIAVDPLTTPVDVLAGDVIGYVETSAAGVIGYRATTPDDDGMDFFKAGTAAQGSTHTASSFGDFNNRRLVRAISAKPLSVTFTHNFTTAGTYNTAWTLANQDTSLATTPVQDNCTVVVIESIDEVIPDCPEHFALNEAADCNVLPHKGSDVTYTWNQGDATATDQNVTLLPISFTYSTRGTYNITVKAFNLLTSQENFTEIVVQERLTNPVLDVAPVITGESITIILTLDTGSDFTCDWDFGDGQSAVSTSEIDLVINEPHVYATPNWTPGYTVSVTCSNLVSTVSISGVVPVQDCVTNLHLLNWGAEKGAPFHMDYAMDSGSGASVSIILDGVDRPVTPNSDGLSGQTTNEHTIANSGLYVAELRAFNLVCDITEPYNFTVEMRIQSPTFGATGDMVPGTEKDLDSGEPFTFTVDMLSGSGVTIEWDATDCGGTKEEYFTGELIDWSGQQTHTHLFDTPTTCDFTVKVWNPIDTNGTTKTYTFNVYNDVKNMRINEGRSNTNIPASDNIYEPSIAEITIDNDPLEAPTKASMSCLMGDGEIKEFQEFDVYPFVFTHGFPGGLDGNVVYTISCRIWNKIGEQTVHSMVTTMEPIRGLSTQVLKSDGNLTLGIPVGEPAVIQVRMSGSQVTINVDFGDGSPPSTRYVEAPVISEWQDFTHTFPSSPNNYNITVTATDVLGSTSLTYQIAIQHPVDVNQLTCETDSPKPYGVNGEQNIGFTYGGSVVIPTDAYVKLEYNDGKNTIYPDYQLNEEDVPLSCTSTPCTVNPVRTHFYPGGNAGDVVVTVYNYASSGSINCPAGVYEPLANPVIELKYVPLLPLHSDPIPGLGTSNDQFPSSIPVKFFASIEGTVSEYEMMATRRETLEVFTCSSEVTPFEYLFQNKPGVYDLEFTYSNPLENMIVTTTMTIVNSVNGIVMDDFGIMNKAGEEKVFLVEGDLGTNACLTFDFGDGTIEVYGLASDNCGTSALPPVTLPRNFTHVYTANTQYVAQVKAENYVSKNEFTMYITISGASCQTPSVSIKNNGSTDPISAHQAPLVQKNKAIQLLGIVENHCEASPDNTKLWTVFKVDPITGKGATAVDLTGVTTNAATIVFPKRFFPETVVYEFRFCVSIVVNDVTFENCAFTYINIVKSDISCTAWPGGVSQITVGEDETIEITPECTDPDDVDSSNSVRKRRSVNGEEFSFTYWCRGLGEIYKEDRESGSISTDISGRSKPKTREEILANSTSKGGCFRKGPGAIGDVDGLYSGQSLKFDTINFQANESYELIVQGRKDNRKFDTILYIHVTTGAPPPVTIRCLQAEQCEQGSNGQRLPPNYRLALQGECSRCGSQGCTFEWRGSRASPYTDKPNSYQIINNFAYYVDGALLQPAVDTQAVAIMSTLFKDHPSSESFDIELKCTKVSDGATGRSHMIVNINTPPHGGTCLIKTLNGTTVETNYIGAFDDKFVICCHDFYDNDNVKKYRYVLQSPGVEDTPIYYNLDSCVTTSFPFGTWKLMAEIYDDYDAFSEYTILERITLVEPSEEDADGALNAILSDDDRIFSNGDSSAMVSVVASVASSLELISNRMDEEMAASNVQIGEPYGGFDDPKPTNVTKEPTNSTLTPEEQEKLIQKAEENRYLKALTVQTCMAAFTGANFDSADQALEKVSAIKAITKNPSDLSFSSLATMGPMARNIVDVLDSTDVVAEVKQELAGAVLAICGSLAMGRKNQAQNPGYLDKLVAASDPKAMHINMDPLAEGSDPQDRASQIEMANKRKVNEELKKEAASLVNTVEGAGASVAMSMVAAEKPKIIQSPYVRQMIEKNSVKNLKGRKMTLGGCAIEFPNVCGSSKAPQNCGDETICSVVFSEFSTLPINDENDPNNPEAQAPAMSIYFEDGSKFEISDLEEPIDIDIENTNSEPMDEESVPPLKPTSNSKGNLTLSYRSITLEEIGDVAMSLEIEVTMTSNVEQNVSVYVSFGDEFPSVNNVTDKVENYEAYGNSAVGSDETIYVFVNNTRVRELMTETGTTIAKVLIMNATGEFSIKTFQRSCSSFDPTQNKYTDYGMVVQPKTGTDSSLKCASTHLTTFAGGWVVAPNTIDWDFVFANMDFAKNLTIYIFMIVIFTLYILVAIWARRQDKKDILKLGVTPLADNDPRDKYYYEVIVYTGLRQNCGTKSKVNFILSGERDETDVRELSDDKRDVLQRGNIDSFLMTTPGSLGDLQYCRIWHDNSGKGPYASWFLKHFLVHDLQTHEKFHFIANKWFAVEEGDGQIDRLIPVAGLEQKVAFGHLFEQTTRKNMSDGHLWFSILTRPPQSRFTRLQRVSSCLSLLFCTMLTNAMFYQRGDDTDNVFTIGPFALSPEMISIGVMSNLIVFPVNLAIVMLFRKSRLRKKRQSRIQNAIQENKKKTLAKSGAASVTDIKANIGGSKSQLTENDELDKVEVRPDTATSMRPTTASGTKGTKKKKGPWMFPWWGIIIGWILVFVSVLGSAVMVLFYGIDFGDIKCKQWISSMIMSMFMSIFLTQPIKVFLIAIFFSLVFKKSEEEDEDVEQDEEEVELQHDEELLHSSSITAPLNAKPRKVAYRPPDPKALEKAREHRVKELKMFDIIREIVLYGVYLWVLMVISYGFRDPDARRVVENMESLYVERPDYELNFTKIRTNKDFFHYLNQTLIRGIRAQSWYNGEPPFGQRGFTGDRVGRLMGYVTLRQLRIKPGGCPTQNVVAHLVSECNTEYSIFNEDEDDYGIGWAPANGTNNKTEYKYMTSGELDTYPIWGKLAMYGGGGYVVKLTGDMYALEDRIEELRQDEWIDKYTRAVLIEFSVYNPYVNIFVSSVMICEWIPSGGIFVWFRFEPLNLLSYYTSSMLFQVACEIVYVLFILYFIVHEIRQIYRERSKYFKQFWNWVEVIVIAFSLGALATYFYRLIITNGLTEKFIKNGSNGHNNFQYVAYWNEMLMYMVGFLCFIGTIKFIRLLRFNKRMSLLAATLKHGATPLMAFGIIFFIVFFAFVQFFFLLLSKELNNFSSIINSAETTVQMMLGRFSFNSMKDAQPVLAPFFFFLFIIFIYLILINMFVTILNESFSVVKSDIDKQSNEYEMVDFIMQRFKGWTGFGGEENGKKPTKGQDEKDLAGGVSPAYQKEIDNFPDKVERLLNCISKVYFDQDRFDQIFLDSRNMNMTSKEALKELMKDKEAKKTIGEASGRKRMKQPSMTEVEHLEQSIYKL
ncbi:unnamed protein product [Owenia fusiformis]|uniref:PKD domain-containing protein n=1 Tax=Owenia fusiformis TaxID=6347 RepID=A0A8S4PKW0_OWEFU|nr:unnamed protein product [Owenia fusiformis]